MVRQIVLTALIAAGNLWPSLAASQTVTPLWPAAPERSADVSARRDDATCPGATFATASAQAQKSSKPSVNNSPLVLSATYIGQAAGNPRGGVRQDIAYAGRLLVSGAVDLNRFIPGGSLNVWFTNRQGRNLADFALGTSTGVQEIYSPQASHLSVLSYEQTFFHGRLELEAGRTPANVRFFSSLLCGYLQTNSACGSPTFLFKISNLTYFPPSSWGARVKVRLTDDGYVHVGVYEVNPDRTRADATGLEWSAVSIQLHDSLPKRALAHLSNRRLVRRGEIQRSSGRRSWWTGGPVRASERHTPRPVRCVFQRRTGGVATGWRRRAQFAIVRPGYGEGFRSRQRGSLPSIRTVTERDLPRPPARLRRVCDQRSDIQSIGAAQHSCRPSFSR
jgi:Carbohydrate-selective porin, OprB family